MIGGVSVWCPPSLIMFPWTLGVGTYFVNHLKLGTCYCTYFQVENNSDHAVDAPSQLPGMTNVPVEGGVAQPQSKKYNTTQESIRSSVHYNWSALYLA